MQVDIGYGDLTSIEAMLEEFVKVDKKKGKEILEAFLPEQGLPE